MDARRGTMRLDLHGQVFGRLVALSPVGKDKSRNTIWLCRCSCGRRTKAITAALRNGSRKSCGCIQDEIRRSGTLRLGKESLTTRGLQNVNGRVSIDQVLEIRRLGDSGMSATAIKKTLALSISISRTVQVMARHTHLYLEG
jgi:hypothetical protein